MNYLRYILASAAAAIFGLLAYGLTPAYKIAWGAGAAVAAFGIVILASNFLLNPDDRDPTIRRRMMSRLRREYEIANDERILQLDTTHLTLDEETDLLIDYWMSGEPEGPLFHEGPPPRIRPPSRKPVGLSGRPKEKSS